MMSEKYIPNCWQQLISRACVFDSLHGEWRSWLNRACEATTFQAIPKANSFLRYNWFSLLQSFELQSPYKHDRLFSKTKNYNISFIWFEQINNHGFLWT